MLRRCGIVAAFAAALAVVPTAAGDGGSANYTSKLTSVSPNVKGLMLRVVDGDDAIELRNRTGKNIMVPGYEREPYLRFLVGGRVEVNVKSPAKYLNEERYGAVKIPEGVGPKAKPEWVLVSDSGAYTWHEHRIHWMSTDRPPIVKDAAVLTKVFDWVVPMSVGGKTVKAGGTLWWIPTGQKPRAEALIAAAVAKQAREKKAAAAPKAAGTQTTATTAATTAAEAAPPAAAPPSAQTDDGNTALWVAVAVLALALASMAAYVVRLRRRGEPGQPAGEVW